MARVTNTETDRMDGTLSTESDRGIRRPVSYNRAGVKNMRD